MEKRATITKVEVYALKGYSEIHIWIDGLTSKISWTVPKNPPTHTT